MTVIWPFLLKSPPSLYLSLHLPNLTPILESLYTTPIILSLERTPCILRATFNPHLKSNVHVKSLVTQALPHINILKALTGTISGQQEETILSPISPFSSMQLLFGSEHLTIPQAETLNYPKLFPQHSQC